MSRSRPDYGNRPAHRFRGMTDVVRSSLVDAVGAGGGVVEQGGAFRGRVVLRETLAGVEENMVRERYLIDREIALEHAAAGAELLDAITHDRRHRSRQFFRADRLFTAVPVKPEPRHADAAE